MKAKITKCSNSVYWYAEHIGQEFEIHRFGERYVWVREPNDWGCLNFIEVQDMEYVEEVKE